MNDFISKIKSLAKYSPNSVSQKDINLQLEKQNDDRKKDTTSNYYHSKMTREQAEKSLTEYYLKNNRIEGCFLMRPCTTSSDDVSLSVIFQGKCHHYKVTYTIDAYYVIGDGPLIHGLDQLVLKYQTNKHGLPCILSKHFVPGEQLPLKTKLLGKTNLLHESAGEPAGLSKLKLILKSPHCPDIDEKDENGRTALHIACECDNVDGIKEIMRKKPSTNLKDKDNYTPLHRAAEENKIHVIAYLLENGIGDPTERSIDDNYVPLHVAAEKGNFVCVKMLLKYNVADQPRTSDDKTPLDLAIEKGCEKSIEYLEKYEPKKPKTKSSEWLHDGEKLLTRELAQKMLINAKADLGDGVFLVRRKSNNLYVLSLMTGNDFFNYEICSKDDGKYIYIDDGPYFRSLEHMIEHHFKYEDGLPSKLNHSISSSSKYSQTIQIEMQRKASLISIEPIIQEAQFNINTQHLMKEVQSSKQMSKKKQFYKLKAINEKDIKLEAIIGEGEFGTVFKGTFEGTKQVAIKILKDCHATNEFKREAEIMQKLSNHPCILRIFGVINDKDKFMMIQELMAGSVLDKLYETPRVINDYNLKMWSIEIVSGMEHMESKKIVHRDLAARNILLGANLQAKISDFGLSRAYEGDEYTQRTDSKIPIKWYAPESIERCRFTSKSDVWSFGITLWEMWTYGEVPYGESNGSEVFEFIKSGKRLEKPKSCPQKTYDIMKKCWEWNEENRISFHDIKKKLDTDSDYEPLKSIYFDNGQF
jgi:hypothetical protein